MALKLSILYRGPLSSCNYACRYCPFAKRTEGRAAHDLDRRSLERFIDWVEGRGGDRISVFFTPWGEALIQKRYQEALVRLTRMPNVDKAAIQTNLSCRLEWVEGCDKKKLGLWTTYHPTQTTRARFLKQCAGLESRNVRYSVGAVGLRESFEEIVLLRNELPPHVYLWINAYKRIPNYYTPEEIERLEAIDPLFTMNLTSHPSRGCDCLTGQSVISVDGDGTIRRCHFVKQPIGNIYEPGWEETLGPRRCPRSFCDCHIGYVHRPDLKLHERFGEGVLERILLTEPVNF